MAEKYLNTFAILVLSKDHEWLDPKYEYYEENDDESRQANEAIQADRDSRRSLMSYYARLKAREENKPSLIYYYIKFSEDNEPMIMTRYDIIPDEEIENQRICGPFMNMNLAKYYLSQLNSGS